MIMMMIIMMMMIITTTIIIIPSRENGTDLTEEPFTVKIIRISRIQQSSIIWKYL